MLFEKLNAKKIKINDLSIVYHGKHEHILLLPNRFLGLSIWVQFNSILGEMGPPLAGLFRSTMAVG
jgi:hypothetical protein